MKPSFDFLEAQSHILNMFTTFFAMTCMLYFIEYKVKRTFSDANDPAESIAAFQYKMSMFQSFSILWLMFIPWNKVSYRPLHNAYVTYMPYAHTAFAFMTFIVIPLWVMGQAIYMHKQVASSYFTATLYVNVFTQFIVFTCWVPYEVKEFWEESVKQYKRVQDRIAIKGKYIKWQDLMKDPEAGPKVTKMIDDEEKRLRDEAIENMKKAAEAAKAESEPGAIDNLIAWGSSIKDSIVNVKSAAKAKVADAKADLNAAAESAKSAVQDAAESATAAAKDAAGNAVSSISGDKAAELTEPLLSSDAPVTTATASINASVVETTATTTAAPKIEEDLG
jgi:hypothetical protein